MSEFEISAVATAPEASDHLGAWLTFAASAIASLAWPLAAILLAVLLRKQVPSMLSALKRFKGLGIEAEFEREVGILAATAAVAAEAATDPLTGSRDDEAQKNAHPSGSPTSDRPEPESPVQPDGGADGGVPNAAELAVREAVRLLEQASTDHPGDDLRKRRQVRLDILEKAEAIAAQSPKAAVLLAWTEVEAALFDLAGVPAINSGMNVWRTFPALREKGLVTDDMKHAIRELQQLRNKAAHDRDFEPGLHSVYQYVNVATGVVQSLYAMASLSRKS